MKIKKYIKIETRADGKIYYYGYIKYYIKFLFFKIPVVLNLINGDFRDSYDLAKCEGDRYNSYPECAENLHKAIDKFSNEIKRQTIKNTEIRELRF